MAVLQYGTVAGLAIYILWWINTGLAVITFFGIPFIHLKYQPPGLRQLPPAVLLPVIAALTSAAGAGVICTYSHISARLQVPAILISYLEVGAGLALAAGFDAVALYQRLEQVSLPPGKVYQDMIICGPFGQGAFALQALGVAVQKDTFAKYHRGTFLTASAAGPIGYISQFFGLLIWGYGVFWWFFAVLNICHTLCAQPGGWRSTQFSLAAWSLIFPWGVFTNAAVQFSKIMDSPAFGVISTVLLLVLLVIWFVDQILTVKGIVSGRIFSLNCGWNGRYHHRGTSADPRDV